MFNDFTRIPNVRPTFSVTFMHKHTQIHHPQEYMTFNIYDINRNKIRFFFTESETNWILQSTLCIYIKSKELNAVSGKTQDFTINSCSLSCLRRKLFTYSHENLSIQSDFKSSTTNNAHHCLNFDPVTIIIWNTEKCAPQNHV